MRNVNWDSPSREDREWIEKFGSRAMRKRLESSTPKSTRVVKDEEDEEETPQDDYEAMKLDDLKLEAANRKNFNTKGIKTRADLIAALREYDASTEE